METILKSKCEYIANSLKIEAIAEKLDVCSYEWFFSHLEITTDENCVLVDSEVIADAWIKEIDKIKTMI